MMTMTEGNTEEMIVTDSSPMIKIGAMTMTVVMTTTTEIDSSECSVPSFQRRRPVQMAQRGGALLFHPQGATE